jgi:hypothetical protein
LAARGGVSADFRPPHRARRPGPRPKSEARPSVRQNGRHLCPRLQRFLHSRSSLEQKCCGRRWLQLCVQPPREDASGEVVQNRLQVDLRSIQKSNYSRVDVPDFVRLLRSYSFCRLTRMNPSAGTPPAAILDEPIPRGCRRIHLAQPVEHGCGSDGCSSFELSNRKCEMS